MLYIVSKKKWKNGFVVLANTKTKVKKLLCSWGILNKQSILSAVVFFFPGAARKKIVQVLQAKVWVWGIWGTSFLLHLSLIGEGDLYIPAPSKPKQNKSSGILFSL